MWTLDNSLVTLDQNAYTLDGATVGPRIPGRTKPDFIENVRTITSRGKMEAALLIVLAGAAAILPRGGVAHTPPVHQIETQRVVTSYRGNPLISVLSAYPNDVTTGFDNFEGWPPAPPPFIQPRKVPLVSVYQTYAAYDPIPDVIYDRFRRKPHFVTPPDFIHARGSAPLNLTIKPAPAGDLTTQLRKPAFFGDAAFVEPKNPGAWHIVLLPDVGPQPPPPPPPPVGGWPPPSTITNLPCRGAWELPGGRQAIWVVGSGCFLMTPVNYATGSTQSTFTMKRVGTLATKTGPVCIRDNGAGGTVVIVDGPYGYYYTFTAVGGTVGQFQRITDPAFLGADRVAFIDGWWIFNQPGSQTFYTPTSTYSLKFSGSSFALIDGATDNLVTLYENKEELWLVGEKHTEIWYDAGGTYFPFQRLVSTMLQVGCCAKHSIARFAGEDDGLAWLARSERGQNVVVRTRGFGVEVISPPPINDAIASYTKVDDAFAYTYQEDGHEFYVLTFPSAVTPLGLGATWVFDGMTGLWHERLSFEPYSGKWNRHRSNCFVNFQNQRLVGDYQNGSIYQMTRSAYTDAGWPLVAWRRTPHVWDGGARERVFMASLQIEFSPGVGNQTGMGTDPQAVLTQSKDGGTTWGQEIRRSIGRVGHYIARTIWRRLGVTRDSVFDVKVYDPVKRDVVGATLKRGDNSPQ
jgi:hypothetical protein